MSTKLFRSYQIKGKGIGKKEIVPTINLAIPSSFDLPFGVYAGRVHLQYESEMMELPTALHYGPRPTDKDSSPSLELHVLDAHEFDTSYNAKDIEVEIVERIRDILRFDTYTQLRNQIQRDIVEIKETLEESR